MSKMIYEEVKSYIESFGNTLLSKDYKNNKEKLHILCKCGRKDFYRSLASMKQHEAYYCEICKNETISKHKKENHVQRIDWTYELIIKKCKELNVIFLSDIFDGMNIKYNFMCKCGNVFERTLNKVINNNQTTCLECSKQSAKNKLNHNYLYVKQYIESFGNKLLSNEYINNETKLEIQCKCGEVFYRTFTIFKDQQAHHCGKCERPKFKGENKIWDFLELHNIEFKHDEPLECKNKKPLPFDFVLYINNEIIAIEYDGKQHYKVGCFNNDLLDLMNRKRLDNIKTQYCKDNNIRLIRIPYWEYDNIEEILSKELKVK